MNVLFQAAHYIGQGCNVVLCIQQLKDGVVIDGEKVNLFLLYTMEIFVYIYAKTQGGTLLLFQLTTTGVLDYNRPRSYLADLANRDGVPIFDDVAEAVECAVKKLRHDDL